MNTTTPVYVELDELDEHNVDWEYGKHPAIENQKHPKIETVIPKACLKRMASRAKHGASLKLQNLLEFRSLPLQQYKDEQRLMQAYREAAEAMLIAVSTLRRDMWIIRDYPDEQLWGWLAEGLSFDHIENANMIADVAMTTPTDLLQDAIVKGGEIGDKPMTSDNMVSYALGWREQPEKIYKVVHWLNLIVKLSHNLGWDDDRVNAFQADLDAFKKRWFE